jgi:hypothetical protein
VGGKASDSVSVSGSVAVSSETDGKKRPASPEEEEARKRRPKDIVLLDSSSDASDEERHVVPAPATTAAGAVRKGRGRPPTTGQYVGLAKAKRALLETEEKELCLLAERQLLEEEIEKRRSRVLWIRDKEGEAATLEADGATQEGPKKAVLLRETSDAVDTIINVAAKSSNLKRTFQKMLKNAAKTIAYAAKEQAALTASEELASFERENKSLRREVAAIRKEMMVLKEEIRGSRMKSKGSRESRREEVLTPTASPILKQEEVMEVEGAIPPPPSPNTNPQRTKESVPRALGKKEEALMGALLRQLEDMMTARFAAIEDRLLPEKRLRPPLGQPPKKDKEAGKTAPPVLSLADLPRRKLPKRAAKNVGKDVAPTERRVGGKEGEEGREGEGSKSFSLNA